MSKKTLEIVADFETTTDPKDVRVWAGGAVDINTLETVFIGNNIHDFFLWLENKNTKCFYHNLKFDGEFIISYLLLNGYEYSDEPKPRTFSALITDNGLFYFITVIFSVNKKQYKKVTFYDSLKKLPFKVATISKAFNLPDEKLDIDYHAFREVGHELTDEERAYLVNDCRIVANALQIQFSKGLKKITNASDAMGYFKELIGKKRFDFLFPSFPIEMDSNIRKAYKGGFTYLKPEYQNRRGLQGITLDVNSLYPSVMYNCLLPYGFPMYFEGNPYEAINEHYPLFIVHVRCAFDVKPKHIPTIQIKKGFRFMPTEYIETTDGDIVDLYLTSIDLALFLDHYNTYFDETKDIEYLEGFKFKGMVGIFKEYIDYWMHIKETETGALRQLAKLMLNSLYGKFATNPKSGQKIPYLDENEVVRYKFAEMEMRDPVYTAMGVFITAYAREKTIRSAQAVYERFIYADTDSLHLIGFDIPDGLEVHPTKLGAWKNEGEFYDSKFIRAKTYMETDINGHTKVTCAGMPDNIKEKVNYDNFKCGSVFDGKLVPRRFKGGVVLVETTFTLK